MKQIINILLNLNRRPKFEVEDWVGVYDDESNITGGGKHVLKTSEADFRGKKFALTAYFAQYWTGPYKICLLDQEPPVVTRRLS